MTDYFRTYTGRHVHPLNPRRYEISIFDIARSLSNLCRFLGHTTAFYSVAQHSVLVSQFVPPEDALWGLLHDAAEAYLCDLHAPVKRAPEMMAYRAAEDWLMRVICECYGLPEQMPRCVMIADKTLLATEFRDVTSADDPDWIKEECGVAPLLDVHIDPWLPRVAEDNFLARFAELAA